MFALDVLFHYPMHVGAVTVRFLGYPLLIEFDRKHNLGASMLRSAFRLSARSPALARAPLLGRVAELSSSLVPTAPAALEQLPPNDPLASSLNAALLRSVSDALVAAPPPELSATQATEGELMHWCLHALGLKEHTAREYVDAMLSEGFDSPAALSTATAEELSRHRIRTGHARLMLNKLAELHVAPPPTATAIPPPRLFDYQTIVENVTVSDAVDSVEAAFAKLAAGKVDVPFPMHIGINETATAGPGDCHIKGGYISGVSMDERTQWWMNEQTNG